ncbi:MAG: tryptophan synthase subunit alpha [Phycisphaerales bacterium]|nr:tryptophan synthase subunit alpha [Phycisphaerales bacterium]
MNRIIDIFKRAKESNLPVLLPFVCAGSPTVDSLLTILPALEAGGASIVEIGFPYSDPVADGPTIAAAMHEAIEQGMNPDLIFEQVASVRDQIDLGLVAMVSSSIVIALGGPDEFCRRASEAGFDGCIFPDLVFEESGPFRDACKKHRLTNTMLISPSTPADRAGEISKSSTGFVYLLARAGITGERSDIPDIGGRVRTLRQKSTTPIACGFGISSPEQVKAVIQYADGAIVGSALVRRLVEAHELQKDPALEAEVFLTELSVGSLSMDELL